MPFISLIFLMPYCHFLDFKYKVKQQNTYHLITLNFITS